MFGPLFIVFEGFVDLRAVFDRELWISQSPGGPHPAAVAGSRPPQKVSHFPFFVRRQWASKPLHPWQSASRAQDLVLAPPQAVPPKKGRGHGRTASPPPFRGPADLAA